MRFTVNYNAARVAVTIGASNIMSVAAGGVTMLSGRTVPFMIADATPAAVGPPLAYVGPLATANAVGRGTYTIECNIQRASTPLIPANSPDNIPLSASDNIPLSIQIQGLNNTSIAMDYYVFVTNSRSTQIELASGVVVA